MIEHASSEAGDATGRRRAVQENSVRRHDVDTGWEDKVRARAHALWERKGRPEGGAERHWAETEEELRAEERDRIDAPAAPAAGTETRTEPGGPVDGRPQAGTVAGGI
jgi:Protein of unknown function (DUF2934)